MCNFPRFTVFLRHKFYWTQLYMSTRYIVYIPASSPCINLHEFTQILYQHSCPPHGQTRVTIQLCPLTSPFGRGWVMIGECLRVFLLSTLQETKPSSVLRRHISFVLGVEIRQLQPMNKLAYLSYLGTFARKLE